MEIIIAKLTVDLCKIKQLIKNKREILGGNTKVCAVVKANAYGLGIEKISQYILPYVDYYAVARIDELISLKKAHIYKPILILSPLMFDNDIIKSLKFDAELTVDNISLLEKINHCAKKLNKKAKIHIKIDTGMNRYGLKNKKDFSSLLEKARELYNIKIVGVYSHFACNDCPEIVEKQIKVFDEYKKICSNHKISPLYHISSSFNSSEKAFSLGMVRLGICLYEIDSGISLSGEILEIKQLNPDESLGYGFTFTATKLTRVACINIGYGDISIRKLSNKGQVIINGKKCNIIGNVCMDCLFADVTNVKASKGDIAILFGNSGQCCLSVCEVASKCDTISYEILTSISSRVKREYKV